MFRSLRVPFQFKVYLLIFLLFALLLHLTISRINYIVTQQSLEKETIRFESVKTVFNNLLLSKIESLLIEARLLADQVNIRQSLEMLDQGRLVESYLASSNPNIHPRNFVIFTDGKGHYVDGNILIQGEEKEEWIIDPEPIEALLGAIPAFRDVLTGKSLVAYTVIEKNLLSQLFVLSSEPVWDLEHSNRVVGAVTLGFPFDGEFAYNLLSGSAYQVEFIFDNRLLTTTLDPKQANSFRSFWDQTLQPQRLEMLIRPQPITLNNEEYLIHASHLPMERGEHKGLYVIFMSLKETFRSIHQLKQSVISVSLVILCFMLLIGYILARGVTAPVRRLAEAVSKIADGDYSVNSKVRSGDELETLGEEITSLAQKVQTREAQIKDYVQQIEGWNRELEAKVTDRTKDLEEKNFNLKTLSEELSHAYSQIDDELKIVGELQKKLLPRPSLDLEGLCIRSFYFPNGRAGGDYYDFIQPDPNHIFCIIADVSGHGTPAAFIMGITQAISHSLIGHTHSTAQILYTMSHTLMQAVRPGEFVTMFLGRFDLSTQSLTYSIAGHTPPLLYRKQEDQLMELKVEKGLPLGIVEDPQYEEVTIFIQPGDRLLLFTDGIVEAFNQYKVPYGEERLGQLLRSSIDISPDDLLTRIVDDLQDFVHRPLDVEPLEDDVTLVAVDFKPVTAPVSIG